jgi:hypothetical protein
MENKQQEIKPIPKWMIYAGSGTAVTVGMMIIKGVCTGINFVVTHVLLHIGDTDI